MKRDMDLIRRILLWLEQNQAPDSPLPSRQIAQRMGEDEDLVHAHLRLLSDAALIDMPTRIPEERGGWIPIPSGKRAVHGICWAGYEFLDAARDDTRWVKGKEKAGELGFAALKTALDALVKGATGG